MKDDPQDFLWMPDFEIQHEEVHGQEWPLIIVTKFERNPRGERRYVETRIYRPDDRPVEEKTTP
jgi:hypothetical protein